ncbi:g10699 [Coccomyxa viridis]|uniref:G10699 protein n=1 Tax=Coccomyxa viridis TaxID=1274662 RepID=A0ABP1G5Y3_9CHLO
MDKHPKAFAAKPARREHPCFADSPNISANVRIKGRLLGLRGRDSYLDPQILAAYESLAAEPIEEGFSQRASDGRLLLLEEVFQDLRRSKGRGSIQSKGIDVEWNLLPGALALLQEVGEHEVVLEAGRKALEKWEARAFRRDILYAMSLAHLGLASEALRAKEQVAAGCSHLQEANHLLRDAGHPPLSPVLEQEIEQALEKYKPACTLEHLKLPLDAENAGTRKKAIALLQAMLGQPQRAGQAGSRQPLDAEFLQTALSRLTAAELVQLYDWPAFASQTTTVFWRFPGVAQRAALAHIVMGMAQRRPNLLQVAEALLSSATDGSQTTAERVIIKALLNAPDQAVQLLLEAEQRGEVRPASQAARPEPAPSGSATLADEIASAQNGAGPLMGKIRKPDAKEALAYVRAHSPDEETLLEGLLKFTERWLEQVAFPQFRDTAEQPTSPSLHAYYEDKRVSSFLVQVEGGSGGVLRKVSQGVTSSLSKLLPRPSPAAVPRSAPAAAPSAPSQPAELAQAQPQVPRLASGSPAGQQSLIEGLKSWMPAPGSGAATFIAFSVLLGGLVLASRLRHRDRLPIIAVPAETLVVPGETTGQNRRMLPWSQSLGPELGARQAERVLRKWQEVKAEALGPRHSTAALSSIAADPWLSIVQKDAGKGAEAGWFWQYKLNSIKVLDVDTSNLTENGGSAVVTALVDERGDLYANSGKRSEQHSYSNPYTVEYTLVRAADGGWRLSNVLVTGGR